MADADPLAPQISGDALRQMTHYPPDPAAEEIGRRVRAAGANLYETWFGPAERLGRATSAGDPLEIGDALSTAAWATGGRMPFAKPGSLGAGGGKIVQFPAAGGRAFGSPHDMEWFNAWMSDRIPIERFAEYLRLNNIGWPKEFSTGGPKMEMTKAAMGMIDAYKAQRISLDDLNKFFRENGLEPWRNRARKGNVKDLERERFIREYDELTKPEDKS